MRSLTLLIALFAATSLAARVRRTKNAADSAPEREGEATDVAISVQVEVAPRQREVIIVLGQSLNPGGSVPGTLLARVAAAASLWRKRGAPLLVTGGDPAKTGTTEAETMRRLLFERERIPAEAIILEPRAQNTLQNAWEALPLLPEGCGRVVLVTSDFHMPRSAYVFEAVFAYAGVSLELEQHPVTGGQGDSGYEAGINAMSFPDRLRDELNNLHNRVVQEFLPTHIPGHPVPPLTTARLDQAVAEVNGMLVKYDASYVSSEASAS